MEFSLLKRLWLATVLLTLGCTRDLDIRLPDAEPQLVVEGSIETGMPPVVLLTRSSGFYEDFILDSVGRYFVSGARITAFDGTDSVLFTELTLDTGGVRIPVYVGLGMVGQVDRTYTLRVEAEGRLLQAVTTIPQPMPLDSLWWEPIPDSDTLIRLICRFSDPPGTKNYVRYFTRQNSGPFLPGLNSVFEDDLINGQTFDFPLDRGIDRNNPDSFENFGLFYRGDTITVKWCAIDAATFEFWRTLEFELGGQGSPFAAPVIVKSNVSGGLGIWSGYAPTYHTLIAR